MPISLSDIRIESRLNERQVSKSIYEARANKVKTAFLCHSHKDRSLVTGISNLLIKAGWRIYIDWLDGSMPNKPNRDTANKLKKRIREMDYFLFLATSNSVNSRWCPWEIGYADTHKYPERLMIIPTRDGSTEHGSEYLQLYRRIDLRSDGTLAAIDPGLSFGTALRDLV